MNKNLRNLLLKIIVSGALIAFIIKKVDKDTLISNLKLMQIEFIPLIIILIILNYIVSSMRWKKLILHEDSKKISLEYLTSLYFEGSFFNNFMPTSIGGDVYKVIKLGKKLGSNADAFASTFMERFSGVVVLCLISLTGFLGYIGWWIVVVLLWLALGSYFGLKLIKFLDKKSAKIHKLIAAIGKYKGRYSILWYAFFTSILVQLISVLTQYVIYFALGQKLPLFYAMFAFPLITLAGFFIPSLNGIGVQDALFMAMFGAVGVSTSLSLSASLLYHLFRLGVSLIGGVLYAFRRSD